MSAHIITLGQMNFELDYDNSLMIVNAGEQHGAHYLWLHRGLVQSAYYLEVIKHEKKKLVSR